MRLLRATEKLTSVGVSATLTGCSVASHGKQEDSSAHHGSIASAGSNFGSPCGLFQAYLSTALFGENYSGDNSLNPVCTASTGKFPSGTKEVKYRSDVSTQKVLESPGR